MDIDSDLAVFVEIRGPLKGVRVSFEGFGVGLRQAWS